MAAGVARAADTQNRHDVDMTTSIRLGGETYFSIDIKTLFATKADRMIRKVGKRSMPKKLLSKRPHTHHALDDAWEQADLLVNLLHWDPSI